MKQNRLRWLMALLLAALLCLPVLTGCSGETADGDNGHSAEQTAPEPENDGQPSEDQTDGESLPPEEVPTTEDVQTTWPEDADFLIRFYDVPEIEIKWGDCTYFEFSDGTNMLVDCGTAAAGAIIVEDLCAHGVQELDYFIISHFHSDHVGGYKKLVEAIDIHQIYSPGYVAKEFKWIEEDIADRGIPYARLTAGDAFTFGQADVQVLWPLAESVAEDPTFSADAIEVDTNNRSLVLRLTYGDLSVLMTGDIHATAQEEILAAYEEQPELIHATILKIPHHGYENAVCGDFINAVSPTYAVMEGNKVMTSISYYRYTRIGCTTYATWMNGDVLAVVRDGELSVTADNPEISSYYG